MQKSPPLNEEGHTYVLMLSRASLGSLLEPCFRNLGCVADGPSTGTYLTTFTTSFYRFIRSDKVVSLQPFSGPFAFTRLRDANTTRDPPELLPFFVVNLSKQRSLSAARPADGKPCRDLFHPHRRMLSAKPNEAYSPKIQRRCLAPRDTFQIP